MADVPIGQAWAGLLDFLPCIYELVIEGRHASPQTDNDILADAPLNTQPTTDIATLALAGGLDTLRYRAVNNPPTTDYSGSRFRRRTRFLDDGIMVQVLFNSTSSHPGGHSRENHHGSKVPTSATGNESTQYARDVAVKRAIRAPRRGWSMTEYQAEVEGNHPRSTQFYASRRSAVHETSLGAVSEASSGTSTPVSEKSIESLDQAFAQFATTTAQILPRPKVPAPRRSYSVQDYEPIPHDLPKPSAHMTILDLPSELHYTMFDFLDPIDGVCLGLAHPRLHAISKRKYGKVSLGSRYEGPNDMEWAWRGAGPLVRSNSGKEGDLRPKGQVYCRKCGIHRCELHRHLKEWMGEDAEYCAIKKLYGKAAGEDAKAYCYMSSPKNPSRCGRHGPKRT